MAKVSIIDWIVKKLKRCIAIVEDGDTASQAIASGKYVIWKGNAYKASSAISQGDTLSLSNLTAVSDGIGNELNSNLTTLESITKSVNYTKNKGTYTGTFCGSATQIDSSRACIMLPLPFVVENRDKMNVSISSVTFIGVATYTSGISLDQKYTTFLRIMVARQDTVGKSYAADVGMSISITE